MAAEEEDRWVAVRSAAAALSGSGTCPAPDHRVGEGLVGAAALGMGGGTAASGREATHWGGRWRWGAAVRWRGSDDGG